MGGRGSTRWGWYTRKVRTEECAAVSVLKLPRRRGRERPEREFLEAVVLTPGVRLTVTRKGESAPWEVTIPTATTPCRFGGRRWWLLCPGCGRRVAFLFIPPGARAFGCRTCHRLSYASVQTRRHGEGLWRRVLAGIGMSAREVSRDLEIASREVRHRAVHPPRPRLPRGPRRRSHRLSRTEAP